MVNLNKDHFLTGMKYEKCSFCNKYYKFFLVDEFTVKSEFLKPGYWLHIKLCKVCFTKNSGKFLESISEWRRE